MALAALAAAPTASRAQLGTHWDSFNQDYQRTMPSKAPKRGNMPYGPQQQQAMGPSKQKTSAAQAAPTPFATFNLEHKPNTWAIDVRYKMSEGQFMFQTDVGSILNWDEAYSGEFEIKVSRDFMVKKYQLVADVSFSAGSLSTERTSDDDIFNELHIISLGRGSASLSSWSAGIGIRNFLKFGGFDITPSVGWKQKSQNFEMADHVAPAPFFYDVFCYPDANGICADINLASDVGVHVLDYIYIVEPNGSQRAVKPSEMSDVVLIPGIGRNGVVNLAWRMLIPAEDFCWVTADLGLTACLQQYDVYGYNLVGETFGGVSSLNDQRGLTTHKYYVTWSGPYLGATAERAISLQESIKFYGEIFKPFFKAEGDWPLRTDWMHDPSFIDDGGSALGFSAELEYKYRFNPKAAFTLGLGREWIQVRNADTTLFFSDGYGNPAGSGHYSGSIDHARWKNTTLMLGLAFTL